MDPSLAKHVALVGFMGAGKTTIGIEVAARIGRPFRDLDDDTVRLLYYNQHLNVNGSRFFTQAVLPAISKVFARAHAS